MARALYTLLKPLTMEVDAICLGEIEGCILDALLTTGVTLIARKLQSRSRARNRYELGRELP
ncbi:hypothetical protein KEJ39_00480 [Candidatus Bathyarchaeota archaeon]|nr:hypothetical protein [Candidatus Bathyarchaeota archaeon]